MKDKKNMSRISLDVTKEQHRLLKARAALSGKTITQLFMEAIGVIPEQELWLYDPANQKLVEDIQESLNDTTRVDLGSFQKYLDDEK
jgi:uncharacterized protein (DUF1778 family)